MQVVLVYLQPFRRTSVLKVCVASKNCKKNSLKTPFWGSISFKVIDVDKSNKKFELMLTGRAKAYSSFYLQAVTHRTTNRARRRVTSFQPKRVNNYATPPMPVPWRRLVNNFVSQLEFAKKSIKKPYFGVQGHPRSLNSAPIESQYTISY